MNNDLFIIREWNTNTREVLVEINSPYIRNDTIVAPLYTINIDNILVTCEEDVFSYLKQKCETIVRNVWRQENQNQITSIVEVFANIYKNKKIDVNFQLLKIPIESYTDIVNMDSEKIFSFKGQMFKSLYKNEELVNNLQHELNIFNELSQFPNDFAIPEHFEIIA